MITLHVQPGAKRTEIVGMHGNALKIRVQAPPVEGAANEALIAFLAKALAVRRGDVEIVSGTQSREKRVAVEGVDVGVVLAGLAPKGI